MAFLTATNGQTIPANFDGAIRSTFSGNQDYIVKNALNEFGFEYSASSLDVTVKSGVAVIGGISIMSSTTNVKTLPANSTIYLCLRIDRGQVEGQEGMLYSNTSSSIKQDIIFNGSGQRDLLLAVITTNSNGVTGLTDERLITDVGGMGYSGYEILQITNMAVGETTSERLDATVTSVSSSDSSKATASFVGNVVTYTAVASGNATITVNWGTSKTKQVPITVV